MLVFVHMNEGANVSYDPENPPPEGVEADPLPDDFDEGDSADTDENDDTRDKVPRWQEDWKRFR
jgi:hypothetical protein